MFIYPENIELLEYLHKKIIELWLENWEWWSFWYLWWKDKSDLQSVIEFIKNDDYYETFEEKLTHLVYAINKNHIFADWNKRSSIYFWAYFLEENWFHSVLKNKYFINEGYNLQIQYKEDEENLEKHLKKLINIFTDELINRFLREMENIAVYVADNKIKKDLLQKIITSLVYEDDYSEELKLEIYNSINN